MKIVYSKHPLPHSLWYFPGLRGLVRECDICITQSARLHAKVAVFKNLSSMRHFWKLIDKPQPKALAVVCQLSSTRYRIDAQGNEYNHRLEVDPRYFCLMTFALGHLNMEIVSHESVHAGFAYARRVKRSPFKAALRFDEEAIAYPAGRIARSLNGWLYKHDLYRK